MKFALYYYDACPFCQRVLRVLPDLKVEVEKRNVLTNAGYRQQQYAATGRTTVPVLRLEDESGKESWMFESADIIRFLQAQ
ncbi:glutaredoxin family protein [Parathalassolituus penaei]|uniref:Glutathione S-transferase N-terminal domain-containing protein n=1 Tax=Parathalassolituus penaei TaxID=2997323 RepID=A0A9X3EFZ8_9GAMM|nr:glutaredoxin domain-containing protein [Parathalassolituus penaei]MCY0966525.1 glutathione S-transferase N-terminal domain-containing protein [Parathalassolituus penaei]